jgi:hypothetical protein
MCGPCRSRRLFPLHESRQQPCQHDGEKEGVADCAGRRRTTPFRIYYRTEFFLAFTLAVQETGIRPRHIVPRRPEQNGTERQGGAPPSHRRRSVLESLDVRRLRIRRPDPECLGAVGIITRGRIKHSRTVRNKQPRWLDFSGTLHARGEILGYERETWHSRSERPSGPATQAMPGADNQAWMTWCVGV